eukprot:TRINITY_DN23281_c0_g7_i1.p1 TRINITY_DN23281_c0_g7~~TRINITY_DN23281_c0_g7_i1.p1  ORF type:complete len:184 (-),score=26.80 TRINITY_DN23281_c0_g7_i1:445-996(-)
MGQAAGCCSTVDKRPRCLPPQDELKLFSHFVHDKLPTKGHGLHGVFDALGGQNDDKITRDEFTSALTNASYPGTPENMFALIDVDNQGIITKDEFCAITKAHFIHDVPMRHFKNFIHTEYSNADKAFVALDVDHDQQLSEKEFCFQMQKLNYDADASIIYKAATRRGFVLSTRIKVAPYPSES